jgi:hypothetical protein
MANAMLDARQEDGGYRRVELITGRVGGAGGRLRRRRGLSPRVSKVARTPTSRGSDLILRIECENAPTGVDRRAGDDPPGPANHHLPIGVHATLGRPPTGHSCQPPSPAKSDVCRNDRPRGGRQGFAQGDR